MFFGKVATSTEIPIENAKVRIVAADGTLLETVRTDAKGVYQFTPTKSRNFHLEISATIFYSKYISGNYDLVNLLEKKQFTFPTVFLVSNLTLPQKDTVPMATEQYLYKKLLQVYDVLPTGSAYELFYFLNPNLRSIDTVPYNYKIVEPKPIEFTPQQRQEFKIRFNEESEKDRVTQQILSDTIKEYNRLNLLSRKSMHTDGLTDTIQQILVFIADDLNDYVTRQLRQTRKFKAVQLTRLVQTCNKWIRNFITTNKAKREELELLLLLFRDISRFLPSKSFETYFTAGKFGFFPSYQAKHSSLAGASILWIDPVIKDAFSGEPTIDGEPLKNNLRAFKVSVYVAIKVNNEDRLLQPADMPDRKFIVTFYPGALRNEPTMRTDCKPLATLGEVILEEGVYEYSVYSLEGKEYEIISQDGNTFDTSPAFSGLAKTMTGVNYTEIKVYVRELKK